MNEKRYNGVMLVGAVSAKSTMGFELTTVKDGFRNGEVAQFTEKHLVISELSPEIGQRCAVIGYLAQAEINGKRVTRVHAVSVSDSQAADENMAKVEGRTMGGANYRPPDQLTGKQGFGWLLIDTAPEGEAPKPVRVALFQQQAAVWARECPANAVVSILGWIKNRSFIGSDGDEQVITEIVANPAKSRIIERPVFVDVFASLANPMTAGAMAYSKPVAAGCTMPAETKPAKSKGGAKAKAGNPAKDDL